MAGRSGNTEASLLIIAQGADQHLAQQRAADKAAILAIIGKCTHETQDAAMEYWEFVDPTELVAALEAYYEGKTV
jgi:hypothetical protein